MSQDFSWEKSAQEYVKLYKSILGLPEQVEESHQQAELVY